MRVTFDTNILVSAFEFPMGRAAQVLDLITSGRDTLFLSEAIIDELTRVLIHKFRRDASGMAIVTNWLDVFGHIVASTATLAVLADEPDNRVLECALAANADVIVTGDRAMLALGHIHNTRIVSLAEYLAGVDDTSITS